ncbi:iron uptake system protein EfeO [Aeromicrobium sp. IC_218]|uniref:iron uptake system protein EfeO n=1 Tax=Aeromicrobium sp. IC_218 TaxID=2545468 RepID=UPI001039B35A|nr:iron uptake system protein EfeO [Aeromicrobium sp. IC_218]TCI97510.1 PbrT family lead (Pb2+) uptake porter [Aeromicrobium sp. IC_218]
MHRPLRGLAVAATLLLPLAACTENSDSSASGSKDTGTIAVESSADACELSADEAPSGNLVFTVKNTGPDVTEFYLLAEDGLRIVSEVENIGPGLSRDLVVTAKPGTYVSACKPGMVGDGIRGEFTVTDSGKDVAPTGALADQVAAATTNYVAYVKDQTEQLLAGTRDFVEAYEQGDDDRARELYAATRVHWERIEPVAESFGDLDPRMDLREADLEAGQEWTGWHRLEKDLWPPKGFTDALSPAQRATYADQLLADTQELYDRTHAAAFAQEIDATAIGNGAKGLLDEVATGKVTGEEEIWSHTDLWDFQANVDGAKVAYDGLRDIVVAKDEALATQLDTRFEALQGLLDQHREGEGFVGYDALSTDQVKQLAASVDALSEPLARLTAAVVL